MPERNVNLGKPPASPQASGETTPATLGWRPTPDIVDDKSEEGASGDYVTHIKLRHVAAIVGAGLAIGVGYGIAAESHTNEVARGKIITAEYCLTYTDNKKVIDNPMLDCLHGGVPGGRQIHADYLHAGDPLDYIRTYIVAQQQEAASIEPGRIVEWSIAPFVVAAAAAYWLDG